MTRPISDPVFDIGRDLQRAYDEGYEQGKFDAEVDAEPKWIPCSERLPSKERKTYWVCTDTEYQCECRWTNDRYGLGKSDTWGWKIFDIPQYSKVIAWRSLPEPYKAGDTE